MDHPGSSLGYCFEELEVGLSASIICTVDARTVLDGEAVVLVRSRPA